MSDTPNTKKLLIKPGNRIFAINPYLEYLKELGQLPDNVEISNKLDKKVDVLLFFVKNKEELDISIEKVTNNLKTNAILWILYPKGSSKIKTDINRDILWNEMKKYKRVGVSIVSFSQIWSAMRFKPE